MYSNTAYIKAKPARTSRENASSIRRGTRIRSSEVEFRIFLRGEGICTHVHIHTPFLQRVLCIGIIKQQQNSQMQTQRV